MLAVVLACFCLSRKEGRPVPSPCWNEAGWRRSRRELVEVLDLLCGDHDRLTIGQLLLAVGGRAERTRQMAEARLLAQVNLAQNLAYHPELDGFVFSALEINAARDRGNRLQQAKTALSASHHQTLRDPSPLTIGMPALQPTAF